MADHVSPEKRSEIMSRVRGKDTRPELKIRSALHRHGYRFRLHGKDLPGKPDLVLPKYNAVILVHGCFWHCHDCHLFKWPSTKPDFWREKIIGNRTRDKRNRHLLKSVGWRILTVWECSIRGKHRLPLSDVIDTVSHWLESQDPEMQIGGSVL